MLYVGKPGLYVQILALESFRLNWDLMGFITWTPVHQSLLAADDDITLLAGSGPAHSPGQLGAELP